jgi:hypothetical protein
MEAVALTAGLVPLFQSCFDIYDKISAIRNATGDLSDIQVRLKLEMDKVCLTESNFNKETLSKSTLLLMKDQLKYIEALLKDVEKVVVSYLKSNSGSGTGSNGGGALQPRIDERGFSRSPMRRLMWVAKDKTYVNDKMSLLHLFVESLWSMVSTMAERTAASYKSAGNIIATRDETVLSTVAALPAEFSSVARAARVRKLLLQSQMVSFVGSPHLH